MPSAEEGAADLSLALSRQCSRSTLWPGTTAITSAAAIYLSMKYISQLTAITEPTNSTQQYTP